MLILVKVKCKSLAWLIHLCRGCLLLLVVLHMLYFDLALILIVEQAQVTLSYACAEHKLKVYKQHLYPPLCARG